MCSVITREATTAGRVHFPAHSILSMRQCPHPQRGRRPGGGAARQRDVLFDIDAD